MSNGVNIASEGTQKRMANALEMIADHLAGQAAGVTSWAEFQSLIRHGLGASAFPVGSTVSITHESYGTILMDVLAHDVDRDPRGRFEHSVTLGMHYALEGTPFDATEALYHAPEELAAGTYHFALPSGYEESYGGGKSIMFTLTQNVPKDGVILFPWGYQVQVLATKVSTYASQSAATPIETVSVSEGTDGTDLGTANGTTAHMNHIQRARYGSNRWKESSIRAWLNSEKAAGSWWTPQTEFDRPPTYTSRAGFLKGLSADFLAILGEADHIAALNTATDGGGSETTRDRMFLLSSTEVGLGKENGIAEGVTYPFYEGETNADRIKTRNGAAVWWWLRGPVAWGAYVVRSVNTGGELSSSNAYNGYSVAAACVIY